MSPEQLAEDHWSYVYATLVAHGCEEDEVILCGYHYKTAFVHGYKHAVENMEPVVLSHSKRREDNPLPLTPEQVKQVYGYNPGEDVEKEGK